MAPPSSPSTTTTASTRSQLRRRLRSISRKKVVGTRGAATVIGLRRSQVHLGHHGVRLGDLEVVALAEPEHAGDEDGGEGLDRRVELAHRAVVMLAAEPDLVLRRGQLLLELHDVLVRLELRVVLDQREELSQRSGEEVLGLSRLAGVRRTALLRADGGGSGLDDPSQGLLLEVHVALDGVDEVRDQIVAALELDADLVPRLVDHVPQADKAVVREDEKEEDDRDRDQQNDEPQWHR